MMMAGSAQNPAQATHRSDVIVVVDNFEDLEDVKCDQMTNINSSLFVNLQNETLPNRIKNLPKE